MTTNSQVLEIPSKPRSPVEAQRIERFIQALNQAMVTRGLSQRRMAAAIGVESGTFTKYLRGTVDPHKVGTAIQSALAGQLGVTLDSLMSFYRGGTYLSGVSVSQIESWIRSEAGQQDLLVLLDALGEAGRRWGGACIGASDRGREPALAAYEWPARVVDESGLSEAILERLGITPERLDALIEKGEIADELVEGFALLLKAEPESIREAFEARLPLG
jgi:transcriptional regulator with XRE-family HTH domain